MALNPDPVSTRPRPPANSGPEVRRVTIKLTEPAYCELREMANERGLSLTGLIRRALATDRFFWLHRGAQVLLREGDSTREVVLLHD